MRLQKRTIYNSPIGTAPLYWMRDVLLIKPILCRCSCCKDRNYFATAQLCNRWTAKYYDKLTQIGGYVVVKLCGCTALGHAERSHARESSCKHGFPLAYSCPWLCRAQASARHNHRASSWILRSPRTALAFEFIVGYNAKKQNRR